MSEFYKKILEDKAKNELIEIAKKLNIKNRSKLNKAQIIEKILENDDSTLIKALAEPSRLRRWWSNHHNQLFGFITIAGFFLQLFPNPFAVLPSLLRFANRVNQKPILQSDFDVYLILAVKMDEDRNLTDIPKDLKGTIRIGTLWIDIDLEQVPPALRIQDNPIPTQLNVQFVDHSPYVRDQIIDFSENDIIGQDFGYYLPLNQLGMNTEPVELKVKIRSKTLRIKLGKSNPPFGIIDADMIDSNEPINFEALNF